MNARSISLRSASAAQTVRSPKMNRLLSPTNETQAMMAGLKWSNWKSITARKAAAAKTRNAS